MYKRQFGEGPDESHTLQTKLQTETIHSSYVSAGTYKYERLAPPVQCPRGCSQWRYSAVKTEAQADSHWTSDVYEAMQVAITRAPDACESEEKDIVDPDSPVDDKELAEQLKHRLGVLDRAEAVELVAKEQLEDETTTDISVRGSFGGICTVSIRNAGHGEAQSGDDRHLRLRIVETRSCRAEPVYI